MDVKMPDGTIIRGVPKGTTKQQLQSRLDKRNQQQAVFEEALKQRTGSTRPDPSFGEAAGMAGLETFVNTMLNIPEATGNVLGQTAGAIRTGDFGQFQAPPGEPQIVPSANDIKATGQVLGESVGAFQQDLQGNFNRPEVTSFSDAQQDQRISEQQRREAAPNASDFGDIVGTGASLAGLRIPVATKLGQRALPAAASNTGRTGQLTFGGVLKDAATSEPVKALARAAGRTAEGGLEAAALSILQGKDPVETAALSAGAQGAGSMILSAFNPGELKGLGRLGLAAGGLTAMFRLGQEFGPGENNTFESIDDAFNKIQFGILAGLTSAAAGAGRINPRNASQAVSVAADSITSMPRGFVVGLLNKTQERKNEGINRVEPVLKQLSKDPTFFGKENGKKIQKAIESKKPEKVINTIDSLFKNSDTFKKRFNSLNGNPQQTAE